MVPLPPLYSVGPYNECMCVKPLSAFIAICCELAGCYEEGSFSLSKGYIYVSIVQNISITISLYYLARKLENMHSSPVLRCYQTRTGKWI